MILALLRGIIVGFVGGIPVGPVNAAVIDTAMRKCIRRAIAIGIGGAFIDALYSQLAVMGLGSLIHRVPGLDTVFVGVGGVVLVVFGVLTLTKPPLVEERVPDAVLRKGALLSSAATGALISLMNPAVLVSWVLIAGTVLSGLPRFDAFIAGVGIFVGTSIWFVMIAWLAAKGRVKLGARAAWVTRTVGVTLLVYGVFLVGKASATVFALTYH